MDKDDDGSGTTAAPTLAGVGDKCRKTGDCETGECCGFLRKRCKTCCSDEFCQQVYGANAPVGTCYVCDKKDGCVVGQCKG